MNFRSLPSVLLVMLSAMAVAAWVPSAGAQGFQQVVLTGDASSAFGMTSGDFDGDGDMDAATTSFVNGSALWIETVQNGPAVPHSLELGYGPLRGIASGDFDSDGDIDLAVACYGEDRFVWLENRRVQGVDSFRTHTLWSPANGAWTVVAGDVNQDGHTDLVTTEYLGNVARVFIQQNGQLVETAAFSVHGPMDAFIADIDGDGDPDVLVGSYTDDLMWLENTGSGWASHSLDFGYGMITVAAADLDNDNDTDLITAAHGYSLPVTWWERTASGYTPHNLSGSISYARDIGVADFNQDGDTDIVVSSQNGVLRWWENTGGGVFTQRTTEGGTQLYCLEISDFDQDGDQDVLVADQGQARLLFYRNSMGVPSVITGTVRAAADDEPVSGVQVRMIQNGVTSTTDGSGRFVLPCAEGVYDLGTRHPCWNDALTSNVAAVSGETTAVDISIVRPLVYMVTSSLNLTAQNGQMTSVPLPVQNPGDGILRVSVTTTGNFANDNWLTVTPDSMEIGPGETFSLDVQITPDTSFDQNWDYAGIIQLHTNACPDSEIQVAVVVYVLDADNPAPLVPREISLDDVYPNPFNATATVRFALPQSRPVTVSMYDVTGRLVRTLAKSTFNAGRHELRVDGAGLSSGLYWIALDAGDARLTRKALLLK